MKLHMSNNKYPVGETAVPSSDHNWNYNDPEHIWERDHFLICVTVGLIAAQQKVISYAQVLAITQEPKENPTAFLERLKRPSKSYQSGLRLLRGTGDFKGQIPAPVGIRHQDSYNSYNSRTLQPLWMRWSSQPPIPFITENRRGKSRPRKRIKGRDKACPDAGHPPGKLYGKL